MPGENEDPVIQAAWHEAFAEFLPKPLVGQMIADREKIWQVLVLLHEIIGHGSGTYDATKYAKGEDPVSALGPLGSALEEQRADLTALVFAGDPKLVEVGIYKNIDEAKRLQRAMYDFYATDFLRRTARERTFTEAHQRGYWLFINRAIDKGAIGWAPRDGSGTPTPENQVLVVKDYEKFHDVASELLGELQRIKAIRDENALKALFAKFSPLEAIGLPWAQAVIERGKDLRINAGYVEQPWAISADGKYSGFGGETLESIAPFWKKQSR